MARYLVTGAAGFIGSHLTETLLARGAEVVAVDSFTDYYDPARKRENSAAFEVIEVDLARNPLETLVEGVDGVYHLAGQPGARSFGPAFADYLERNTLATQRLFEVAAPARVKVALVSSSSVYGDAERYPTPEETEPRPNSPYGITKLACEFLAAAYERASGLEYVALRYFTVYGPRQRPDMAFARIVEALAEGKSFEVFGDGSQSRSFTYVADVVEATIASLNGPSGSIYNIGGGEETTLRGAIELLEQIADRPLEVSYGPPAPGDMKRTKADSSRIERDVGWSPTTSLADGLEAHWRWASDRVAGR